MREHYTYTDSHHPEEMASLLFPEVSLRHGKLLGQVYGEQLYMASQALGLSVSELKQLNPMVWRLPRGGDPGSDVLESFGFDRVTTVHKDVQKAMRVVATENNFTVLHQEKIESPVFRSDASLHLIWESFIESGSTLVGLIGQILAHSSEVEHTFVVAAPTAMAEGMKRLSHVSSQLQHAGKGELYHHAMIQIADRNYQIPDHGEAHHQLRLKNLIALRQSLRNAQ